MASLNISMPKDMRQFVNKRAKATSHSTPTEYIRTLIREDQKRAANDQLERLLLEGLESGPEIDATSDAWWENKRKDLRRRFARKKIA